MSGAAAALKRRDTSAAKAALARRRQRAAHALQPNNSSNAGNAANAPESSSSIPPRPRKTTVSTVSSSTSTSVSASVGNRSALERQTKARSSPLRVPSTAATDPAGSSVYLSPHKPTAQRSMQPQPPPPDSLNAVARNRQSKLSPPGGRPRDRMPSNGTATTASMTVGSRMTMTPPSINRTNRPHTMQTEMQRGSSPLRAMPSRSRSPQTVIHYTTQQTEKLDTSTPLMGGKRLDTSLENAHVQKTATRQSTMSSKVGVTEKVAPSPRDTATKTTANNNNNDYTAAGVSKTAAAPSNNNTRSTSRTSSAVLNARLKARYQSPSHRPRGSPQPSTATSANGKPANAGLAAGTKERLPHSQTNYNHRPPSLGANSSNTLLKSQIDQASNYARPNVKPPVALSKHVANQNPPAVKTNAGINLTINTSTVNGRNTASTSTSRVLAASPRRSAVRDRMNSNSNSDESTNDDDDHDAMMTPSAANTSKRMPTPSNIPINSSSSFGFYNNKNSKHTESAAQRQQQQQQESPSSKKARTPNRSTISKERQEQMSQRLAQRAIDANRPNLNAKTNSTQSAGVRQTPPKVSPPKEFGSISTFLMNDMSILDTSTNNLLDTTLPPVDTPIQKLANGANKENAMNTSVLLEDFHQQPIIASTSSSPSGYTSWNIDASCLKHNSGIMLRSCATNTTIQREKDLPEDKVDDSAVDCRGLGLGRLEEAMTIDKVLDSASTPELRHGDTIRILASSQQHALGAYRSERYGLQLLFLPIFAPSGREDEEDTHWQVFVAEPGKKLLVGKAAVDDSLTKSNNPSTKLGAPVRAGVPVVLRHVTTGGVLSMPNHGSYLRLLTDSFGKSQLEDEQQESLDQLQHHDKLLPSKHETFAFIPFASPPCPQWAVAGDGETESCIAERLFMTSSYLLHPKRRQAEFESQMELSHEDRMEMTSKVKEKIIIEEVIGSFLGLEGRHIRMKQQRGNTNDHPSFGFHLSGTDGIDFEMSLHHLVEQILPMSTSYIRVQHFVNSHHPGYSHGRVMQAFCEGLDTLLQDYVDFVVQLERQHRNNKTGSEASSLLTMKNIFFQISPYLHSMSILEHATRAVRDTKGGALINALWSLERQVYMGDTVAKKVLGILLENASIPYLDMMAEWLESGRLNDPYKEFMVQSSSSDFDATQFDGDDWMAMFSIDNENILEGVTSDEWTKERIMTTGKYWNAVHACQVDVGNFLDGNSPQKIPKLPFNSDSSEIVAYIDSMYQSASRVLVRLLKEKFRLAESMDVMKRYFLLDQGDFVMNFLDVAEDELRKKASDVSVGRVQNWLNASIQQSEQHRRIEDGEKDKQPLVPQALRCRFSGKSTIASLESQYGTKADRMPLTPSRNAYGQSASGNTGIEVFVIDFSYIPFPISLVLSQHAMDKYKLLFRHLLFTKHVERRLIRVWRDHQILKKLGALRGLLGPTFLLRQRMLHFVQNLLYYMSFEVIENNWTEMMTAINANETKDNRQQTVDDILQVHDTFLERTLDACLLTNRDLVRSLTKLMNTVLLFTDQMKRFMDATRIYNDSSILAAEKQLTVQRNLNERRITPGGAKKKTIHNELMSTKKEREALNNRQTRRVGREVISESYQRMVERFGEVFNADLSDFMNELNKFTASGMVANLGVRLDYNGYVTSTVR